MGAPSCSKAASVCDALLTLTHAGVDKPSLRQMRLVMTLSMAMLEAITPEPV